MHKTPSLLNPFLPHALSYLRLSARPTRSLSHLLRLVFCPYPSATMRTQTVIQNAAKPTTKKIGRKPAPKKSAAKPAPKKSSGSGGFLSKGGFGGDSSLNLEKWYGEYTHRAGGFYREMDSLRRGWSVAHGCAGRVQALLAPSGFLPGSTTVRMCLLTSLESSLESKANLHCGF